MFSVTLGVIGSCRKEVDLYVPSGRIHSTTDTCPEPRRNRQSTIREQARRHPSRAVSGAKARRTGASAFCVSAFCVSALLCFCVSAFAQIGGAYDLTWNTIDSGGVMRSTGGDYELSGTIGQPDAGNLSGGVYNLTGGFWFEIPVGDCDYDGVVGRGDIRSFVDCADGPGRAFAPAECACSD